MSVAPNAQACRTARRANGWTDDGSLLIGQQVLDPAGWTAQYPTPL